ncbi:MAG: D-aminoacyl-tRNA deacylase [Marmoricola sp.]
MRAVVQRVTSAEVTVSGEVVGAIDRAGLLVLAGITHDDGAEQVSWLARKIATLRILRDEHSVLEVGAPVLVVSQFTLYGDARKGRRPTWQAAAPGAVAEPIYESLCAELSELGVEVHRGTFGADMAVSLVNDGPVTLMLEAP